ncbi:MAG: hypothetical protein EBX39_04945 [Actinobacteria bacterium]|nr:hypothetical protein [Actinomycetota bacterium]
MTVISSPTPSTRGSGRSRSIRAIASVIGCAGLLAVVGCGSNSSSASGGLPAGARELAGRYAHFDVVAYQDPMMKTLIISTGFSDLEVRDGQLWNQMTFCHADTPTDQTLEVSISDAATRAILPIATPVEVSEVDGRFHIVRPATPTAIGITLADPAHDRLPTDPNDPRITDADGDGHPGVTSKVRISDALQGEVYIARREIFAYTLTQQTDDRLTGYVTDDSEQLVVGASDPIFMASGQWKQIDDTSRNPVIWQRVGADWDCDRLAAERASLFPPNPKVDW